MCEILAWIVGSQPGVLGGRVLAEVADGDAELP